MNNSSSLYDKYKNYKLALKNETLFTYLFETFRYFSLGTPVAFITIDTRWNENNCKFLTFEIVCFHDFLQFFFHLEIFQKYLSFLCSLQTAVLFLCLHLAWARLWTLCLARLEICKSFATLFTESKFKLPSRNPHFSVFIRSKTLLDFNNLRA